MLDRKVFLKCFNTLLLFASIEPDKQKTEMFYKLMANDFEDKEFSEICGDICKTESLFNKYPEPKMFYERKEKRDNTILVEIGTFYVDGISEPEYAKELVGLSSEDNWKVCEAVWDWIYKNKRGELVSKKYVADRIRQFRPQPVEELELPPSIGQKLLGAIKRV